MLVGIPSMFTNHTSIAISYFGRAVLSLHSRKVISISYHKYEAVHNVAPYHSSGIPSKYAVSGSGRPSSYQISVLPIPIPYEEVFVGSVLKVVFLYNGVQYSGWKKYYLSSSALCRLNRRGFVQEI